MPLKIKRVYDEPSPTDGKRVLVDRLWPRGIARSRLNLDLWFKDIAPCDELRKWFNHDPEKWREFKLRYFEELSTKDALLAELAQMANEQTVTLLFAARNEKINHAVALKEYLEDPDSSRSRP